MSLLTSDQISQIRELAAQGVPIVKITSIVGCSRSTVERYRNSKTCVVDGCTNLHSGSAGGYCRTHDRHIKRWGSPVCRACKSAPIKYRGLCADCRAIGEDTAAQVAALRELEAAVPVEVEEQKQCPLCHRRPPHGPAIACPAIGLPACEGTRRPKERAA